MKKKPHELAKLVTHINRLEAPQIKKNFGTHSLSNQKLNDETREKNHTKIMIKRIKKKIKIKNKLDGIKKI